MTGTNRLVEEVRGKAGYVVGTVKVSYLAHTLGVGFCSFDTAEEAKQHILNVTEGRVPIPQVETLPEPVVEPVLSPKVNLNHLDSMTRKRVKEEERVNKKVKYLLEYPELNLKSIQPHKIVGAVGVWIYNTKTRKLAYYESFLKDYLGVKGSTLTNFCPERSCQKTIRKPDEVLGKIVGKPHAAAHTTFLGIKAVESPLTGRINKDCLILEVFN